ncbi:DegT/DnrJ/EryC1/StrS family aminotransferase [Streptomyces sp. NPDC046909]|uniref:DegT/DnrJ/EryC1/StrS family aminotransferase n=1 Tax=Streptomyces sp. NPDC046909 TaxID=3155617 RepID=UPI003404A037
MGSVPLQVSMNARPYLHGPETEALTDALQGGQYGHSAIVEQFEQAVAAYLGVPDMVAVASGTAALHLALTAAGVGPGHEVIVPSQTFCATIHAIVATGAHPRFVEINPDTLCTDAASVRDAFTPNTRAVVPVLYGGRAVDLSSLHAELTRRRITIVEDAAHAFGSHCQDTFVGARPDILTCFSFGPIKNLTCGTGGGIIPRTPAEAQELRTMRALGIMQSQTRRAATTSYTVKGFGLRATMSALNAAIGLAQLQHFDEVAAQRQELWRTYADGLHALDGVRLVDVDIDRTVPFNCVIHLADRDRVFEALRGSGLGVGVHYPPNHDQPAFHRWHRPLPITETSARRLMSLPFHPAMNQDDVHYVISALTHALETETP